MRVNFMLIGAQSCGTTTLSNILNNHPQVVGCSVKEPDFFSTSNDWKRNIIRYHMLFKKKKNVLFFEASTSYTFYPLNNLNIWNDIFDYNPNMKFIYIIRCPIDRIISSYMHIYERGYTNLSIEEAIVNTRLYIDITRYYTQIYPYIMRFGRKNVLIIDFDDLVIKKRSVAREIAEFLSIDFGEFQNIDKIHSNISVGGYKKHHRFDSPSVTMRAIKKYSPLLWNKISDNSKRSFSVKPRLRLEFKKMILNMLHLEILEIQKLIGKDLSKWFVIDD